MTLQPAGTEVAYTITYLEMKARPSFDYPRLPVGSSAALLKAVKPPIWYFLSLYDAVGRDYAWEDMHALPEEEVRPLLGSALSIAAINTPSLCVVSGTIEAIDELEALLARKEVPYRRIHIAVAAHSHVVTPILEPFRRFVRTIALKPPQIPFVSNFTGTWITDAEATDPNYWV